MKPGYASIWLLDKPTEFQLNLSNYCAGFMGHPFKKSSSDNDYYAFQVPCLRTDVLSSQHSSHGIRSF